MIARALIGIGVAGSLMSGLDLGAMAAFLFDVGSKRYPLPLREGAGDFERWREDLERVREQSAAAAKAAEAARNADHTHTEVQGWLHDLGLALGYNIWIAANDVARNYKGGRLDDGCLLELPACLSLNASAEAIRLIDVIWIERGTGDFIAAFEVEHTTSIYSGIVRMLDLALGIDGAAAHNFFLVAPDEREGDVRAQFLRPAFSRVGKLDLRYLPYSELCANRDAIARFGTGLKGVLAIARSIAPPCVGPTALAGLHQADDTR